MVKSTHGNIYQSGFPDLYVGHLRYGTRWIECKIAEYCQFTNAQQQEFPLFSAKGIGIWVLAVSVEEVRNRLTNHTEWLRKLEAEYKKLFLPANWYTYLQLSNPHCRLRI